MAEAIYYSRVGSSKAGPFCHVLITPPPPRPPHFSTQDATQPDYVCWATEGGHTDFPPRDELEVELHSYLRTRFNQKQRVSVERVISGPGIASIYDFLV